MSYCLRYDNNPQKMKDCWQRKEDKHCYYCCFCQPDVSEQAISEEALVEITAMMLEKMKKVISHEKALKQIKDLPELERLDALRKLIDEINLQ